MLEAYELFEIRFFNTSAGLYAAEARCDLVGEASGEFRLPTDTSGYYQLVERLHSLDIDDAGLATLGRILFEQLFHDDIGRAFDNALAALPNGHGLRLSLVINAEQTELTQIPWEFLCDRTEQPLALLNVSVVRYLRIGKPRPLLQAPRPLKILVTAAATEPAFEIERELAAIQAALAELQSQHLVEVHIEEHTTRRRFQRLLRQEFHIWHFIGHGKISQDAQESTLLFEDETGDAETCNPRELRLILEDSGLQTVILNACDSARITTTPYGSLAAALMHTDVGAVIAMQFRIPGEAARPFAEEFYRALLTTGAPIDACVTEGRKAILIESTLRNPDWGTPVVYTRAQSGRLFAQPQTIALPEETPLPGNEQFVGRLQELGEYSNELSSKHFALISGIPGVGKSAFGLALALQNFPPDQIFWFTFSAVEGVEVFIRQLALFLARRGQQFIWEELESARLNNTAPPNITIIFEQLRQALQGHHFLLCFDTIDLAESDLLFKRFGEFIVRETQVGSFDALVISRTIPGFVHDVPLGPLPGLNLADTKELMHRHGLELSEEVLADLHGKTSGNPQLLKLALNILHNSGRSAENFIPVEVDTKAIERYLLREVDATLQESERIVLRALSIMLDEAALRDLVEVLCNGQRVRRDLLSLNDRFLVETHASPDGEMYRLPSLIQAFYYDDLNQVERLALHKHAAAFFETTAHDPIRSAIQYHRGGEQERAAQLATSNVMAAINQGRAQALVHLLQQLNASHVDAATWIEVLITRGRLFVHLRNKDLARSSFEEALKHLAAFPPGAAVAESQARIYCNLGELTRSQKPREALELVQKGIDALDSLGADQATEAQRLWRGRLLATRGMAYVDAGEYTLALTTLRQALTVLPDTPNEWRARTLNASGVVHLYLGNFAQAHEFYDLARSIYERFQNFWEMVSIWLNLGLIDELRGHWDSADAQYHRALVLAQSTANVADHTLAALNLGNLTMKRGDVEAARAYLQECLKLAHTHQIDGLAAAAQSTLADLHARLGEWGEAAQLARAAEELAIASDADYVLPEVYRTLASCAYAQPRERLRLALCGFRAAIRLHDPREIGLSRRAIGLARLANGEAVRGIAQIERSLTYFVDRDVYETARSQAALGHALLLHPNDRGKQLLDEARATFEQLEAALDLQAI